MTAETILKFLADWAVRSTILATLVGALLWAARIKNAHVRLAAWTFVLAGALLMPLATTLTPAIPIPVLQRDQKQLPTGPAIRPPVRTNIVSTETLPVPKQLLPEIALTLWIVIASAMLTRIAIGLWLGARLVRTSRTIDAGTRESDSIRIPVTLGAIQSVIILPADWRDWDRQKLRAVLAHEQSHVARRDPLRQLAASIYRALAWFHPLAWWLRAEIVELAEAASDDAALASHADRAAYAETLLGFIENASHRVSWDGVAMASPKARSRRIERILDSDRELSRPPRVRVFAALSFAALALTSITASLHPVQASPPGQSAAGTCAATGAFNKWMNEDVVYIIGDQERDAFTKLAADQECAHFVEQFWARRDPTPNTQENEYKEEHYRRIAYANQRFSTAGKSGWQTDRGRIYILYGSPDEIDSHPKATPSPTETWRYQYIEGIGTNVDVEFKDRTGTNDFTMTASGAAAQKDDMIQADSIYRSYNPGSSAIVSITAGQMSATIPLDFVAQRYWLIAETRSTERNWSKRVYWNGAPPAPNVTLGKVQLAAGSYVLEVSVKDQDGKTQRGYSVLFEVK